MSCSFMCLSRCVLKLVSFPAPTTSFQTPSTFCAKIYFSKTLSGSGWFHPLTLKLYPLLLAMTSMGNKLWLYILTMHIIIPHTSIISPLSLLCSRENRSSLFNLYLLLKPSNVIINIYDKQQRNNSASINANFVYKLLTHCIPCVLTFCPAYHTGLYQTHSWSPWIQYLLFCPPSSSVTSSNNSVFAMLFPFTKPCSLSLINPCLPICKEMLLLRIPSNNIQTINVQEREGGEVNLE